jgi:hypothetical protein
MKKSEWDSLPYSKLPVQCNHCGNTTPMKVVVEKNIAEILYYHDLPETSKWTEWQILKCPLCEGINVIESFTTGYEDGESDETDIDSQPVFSETIKTVVLFPITDLTIPEPNPNMPSEIARDFDEAKRTFPFSARSSAALLRLAIQKLCKHLGESGKDLNTDIEALVKKGLPSHIQKALDVVRVIGNEAVHPGEINVRDNPEIAKQLFVLVNEIVDDRLSKIHKQAEIEKIYLTLPAKKLEQIRERDKPK